MLAFCLHLFWGSADVVPCCCPSTFVFISFFFFPLLPTFQKVFLTSSYNCIYKPFFCVSRGSVGSECSESKVIILFCSCCELSAIIMFVMWYFMT